MKKRILLLDDEINFTFVMKRLLELTGKYEVRSATMASSFAESAHDFKPDLMLLDCMMPGLDGGEIAGRIENDPLLRDTPFMFLTATIDEPESRLSRCYTGRQIYLPKSIGLHDLCAFIERRLAGIVDLPTKQELQGATPERNAS